MAVDVRVDRDVVDVCLDGWDRVWAMKQRLELPVSRIRDARVDDRKTALADVRWRTWGTGLPGVVGAGHHRGRKARKQFVVVYRGDRLLVIDLEDSTFDRVVLQVVDPDAVAAAINSARSG